MSHFKSEFWHRGALVPQIRPALLSHSWLSSEPWPQGFSGLEPVGIARVPVTARLDAAEATRAVAEATRAVAEATWAAAEAGWGSARHSHLARSDFPTTQSASNTKWESHSFRVTVVRTSLKTQLQYSMAFEVCRFRISIIAHNMWIKTHLTVAEDLKPTMAFLMLLVCAGPALLADLADGLGALLRGRRLPRLLAFRDRAHLHTRSTQVEEIALLQMTRIQVQTEQGRPVSGSPATA